VEGKARGVTPEEIQSVYETATDRYAGLGEGQAKERIADGMRRQRIAQRRTVYLAELRARAGVRIALEPPRVQVEVGDEIVRGAQNAPVTVVLYSDFQCPFCARARSTVEDLTARYKEKVRVVFRNYPLPMHTDAGLAAEAALCAHEQGQFWQMHDALFAHQNALSPADLRRYAGDIGLKEPSFSECLASRRHEKTWQATTRQASDLGIVSTPTFLVNGRLVAGAVPMSVLAEIVDDELVRSGAEPSRQHGGS
jgi:protein-disulfide isomerase